MGFGRVFAWVLFLLAFWSVAIIAGPVTVPAVVAYLLFGFFSIRWLIKERRRGRLYARSR